MNWFQRYGIPGVYFWGILIIWSGAFWHCNFDTMIEGDTLKTIGGVVVISFVPVGYLVTTVGQIIYLIFPCIGVDTRARARRRANVSLRRDSILEYEQEVQSLVPVMEAKADDLEKHRFIQEWMRKRMDVAAISGSLLVATVVAFYSILLFPWILGWNWQFDLRRFVFASIVTGIVTVISLITWLVLTSQLVRVEAEVFRRLSGTEDG